MSSSKTIKKRTLPTVPKGLVESPVVKSRTTQEKNKTPSSRSLFPKDKENVLKERTSNSAQKRSQSKTLSRQGAAAPSPRLTEKKIHRTPVKKLKSSETSDAKSDGVTATPKRVNSRQSNIIVTDAPEASVEAISALPVANYDNSSITVAVRVRPFSARELSSEYENVVYMNGNVTTLKNPNGADHEFAYDFSFWSSDSENHIAPFVSQEDVYNCIAKPLIDWSFEGYNTCLFAYGQTGSGKSYTIMGYDDEDAGIIPRFSKDLFIKTSFFEEEDDVRYSVEISFYEIYNEKIFDLLSYNDGTKQRLCVREHPDFGPYVQGLSKHIVATHADIIDWLEVGNKNRATAATGMNDKSSRSHSVFTIILTQVKTESFEGTDTQMQKTSQINLIDLAGSERASKVLEYNYGKDNTIANTRLKEGGCINKSLHTLGKVISILADNQLNFKKKSTYIPYRDSVLTWLLKESLGGNSRTTMLATISPASIHYPETLSTLRYAQEARTIVNKAKVNEDHKSKMIREMLLEIQRLKDSQRRSGDFGQGLEKEVIALRGKLKETQKELATSTKSWEEKLSLSERQHKEATHRLRRSGVAFTKLEHRLPSLVNLNEDPQLAEVLLYILQEGTTYVGSKETNNSHDIQLRGNLVADCHCIFEYQDEHVTVDPIDDASTFINGSLITGKTTLHHGDRIVIGGDHFFRLNHPKEAAKMKEGLTERRKSVKNFEFAKNELLNTQNERLEAELEKARLKAEADALLQIKEAQQKAEEEMKTQRLYFEQQLGVLQSQLEDTADKRKEAEDGKQSAQEIINQLREHQKVLEDEILGNRKRLNIEALAAKQMLEETKSNHLRILKNLERERKQLENDVETMKNMKNTREKMRASITISVNQPPEEKQRDLLKISLMLREANKINQKLKQPYMFVRDDICGDGKVDVRIRVFDRQKRKTALLSLDQFEEEFTHLKDNTLSDHNMLMQLINDKNYRWEEDDGGVLYTESPRLSLSHPNSISYLADVNEASNIVSESNQHPYLESGNYTMNQTSLGDVSHMSCLSNAPIESTRLSSTVVSNTSVSTRYASDVSHMKSSLFETILDDSPSDEDVSVIARLIKLINTVYWGWRKLSSDCTVNTTATLSEDPLLMLACNLKSLKDIASLLCSIHEAVGLDELKAMSYSFKKDVNDACLFVRNNVNATTCEDSVIDDGSFKQLLFQLAEISGALSLAAVDHIVAGDDEPYFSVDKDSNGELFEYFLTHQNRFLVTMLTEALGTIQNGVENMRNLQLTCTHEMSDDLVDGVMNILTSATTLLRRCKDLLVVYADISKSDGVVYYAKECYTLRNLLTAVVDYNENIYNLLHHSANVAKNCDNLDEFLDVPIELADTTKRICAAGRELVAFVSSKKCSDEENRSLLKEYLEKFEFAGKTVRVGVAIVIQEVEKDLNINQEQSIISFIQNEEPFSRETSACPLNRTSLDVSSLNPHLQSMFKKTRRSSVQPDLFISKYMDTTDL